MRYNVIPVWWPPSSVGDFRYDKYTHSKVRDLFQQLARLRNGRLVFFPNFLDALLNQKYHAIFKYFLFFHLSLPVSIEWSRDHV